MKIRVVFVFSLFLICSNCSLWQNFPIIPFGTQTGYFILHKDDTRQQNGYDIGTGISTQQNANANTNENKGQYEYSNGNEQINLKYSTGIDGILPEIHTTIPVYPVYTANIDLDSDIKNQSSVEEEKEDENKNTDASYNFQYSTIDSSRNESSDANGNVQGEYKYRNNAGEHDLSYKAGSETGFIVTGGSLAIPNGLIGKQQEISIVVPDVSENANNESITSTAADVSQNDSSTDRSETESEEQESSSKADTVTDIPVTTSENPANSNESTEENDEQTESENQENVSEKNESSVSNGSDEGETPSSNESNETNGQEQGYNNEAIPNGGLIGSQANLLSSTGSGLYTFSYPTEHKNLFHTDTKFLIGGDLIVSTDQSLQAQSAASQIDDSSTNEKETKIVPLKVFVPFNDLSIIKLLPSSKTDCKEAIIF